MCNLEIFMVYGKIHLDFDCKGIPWFKIRNMTATSTHPSSDRKSPKPQHPTMSQRYQVTLQEKGYIGKTRVTEQRVFGPPTHFIF